MSSQVDETIEQLENEEVKDLATENEPETDQDRNWRAFLEKRKEEQKILAAEKEKNKQLEQERIQREKQILDMQEAFKAIVDKKESEPFDEDQEARKKILRDEISRMFAEEREKDRKRSEEARMEREILEIKDKMPDLLDVMSQENLAYLEYYHPEIAVPLAKMPDGFEKTKLAYQAIKKHVKMAKKEKEKIEENLSKPRSVHSPLSNETQKEESSGNMSENRKRETWAKMQRLMSGEDEE